MSMFPSLLTQMAFLFSLIMAGYLLAKLGLIPENSGAVLSKLENYLFIPALVLGTFINNFTVSMLAVSGKLLLFSLAIEVIVIPISILAVRLCTKDTYIRKIFLYGLCFSNFGFMGNALVSSMFPDIFFEYVVFTLVLWCIIYLWGVPVLLVGDGGENGIKSRLKSFVNPMLISALVGMAAGLSGFAVPVFAVNVISALSDCMSPVAMLITGITVAGMDVKRVLKIRSIYLVSIIRLVIYPLIFIGGYYLIGRGLPKTFVICAVASLSMPLGLNTVVVPSAYGKDTSVASGMALVSHILSVITIPLIFSLLPF